MPVQIERFFIPGLAHASYLVASESQAVVVDPERNVDRYLDYLKQNQLALTGIFLTHPHADFVAGHAELSARSGAPVFISEKAPATCNHNDLSDGDRFRLGAVELQTIETPGHSPDSICLCLLESSVPIALFSGDTLFAGDVGRPDLRDRELGSRELAAMLHDSLFGKLLKLPAELKVYPAHGAGSLCGRQISSAPFTTIGRESATNWALQFTDREQFIEAMVANLPDRPPYFSRSVNINLHGAAFLTDRPPLKPLGSAELPGLKRGATLLDVRPAALFGDAHAPGSLNIGVASPSFSVWCGFFVNPDLSIALVVEYEAEAQRAQLELARIGFDEVAGFIFADDLEDTLQITQIGARDFLASLKSPSRPLLVDVRSGQEWAQDHLEGSLNVPLSQLLRRTAGFSRETPVTLVCGSGYRSSIAASLLESEGFEHLTNAMGGMHAVRHAKRPRLPAIELAESAITWEI